MKTLDVLQLIIAEGLDIDKSRVFAYNSEIDLPKDNNIFVVMYFNEKTPYSNNVRYEGEVENLKEIQTMNIVEDITIAIMSRNIDARDRAYEISMALASTYSIYQQEKNHLHISTIGNIIDSSFLEETARLNRFDIRCKVLRAYEKVRNIDYYDKFPNTSKFEPEWYNDK